MDFEDVILYGGYTLLSAITSKTLKLAGKLKSSRVVDFIFYGCSIIFFVKMLDSFLQEMRYFL